MKNRKIFLFIILVIKYHKSLRVTYHDINWYVKDYERRTYVIFVHNERKDKGVFEKYEKMFDEVKYFIKVDNNFDNCDEKYMKIRIISNGNLPLKKLCWLQCGYTL